MRTTQALTGVLRRLAAYFTPHLFAVAGGVAFSWLLRWVMSLGGSCRAFCYPPTTIALGVLGGFLGAQLYRSEHPLPPRAGAEP